jgi:hypothetical protein
MARFFRLAVALLVFGVVAPATPVPPHGVQDLGADDGLALLARQHAQGALASVAKMPSARGSAMLFADDIHSRPSWSPRPTRSHQARRHLRKLAICAKRTSGAVASAVGL